MTMRDPNSPSTPRASRPNFSDSLRAILLVGLDDYVVKSLGIGVAWPNNEVGGLVDHREGSLHLLRQ